MRKEDDTFNSEEGARPSSLIPVHKLSTPDPIYDQQLMRELAIINERTRRELGPPPAAPPTTPKRKQDTPTKVKDARTADVS